jgi:hypothetical protein
MKNKSIFILGILLNFTLLQAQENKEITQVIPVVKLGDNVTVKIGGSVRADCFIDTRKPVGVVEDLFCILPSNHLYDSEGNDQNSIMRNYLSMQATKINALFSGPDVLKAKSSSFFEFDFTGGNTVNVRLRHAYIKLNWTKSEVLIGKTWSPLTSTILPSVLGLHTGMPFQPFARGDQFRFTYKPGKFIIVAAAFYQNEHKSFSYINSLTSEVGQLTDNVISNPIPDLHLQFHFKSGPLFAGIVSEYKVILPASATQGTSGIFKTKETVASYAFGGFAEYKINKLTLKGSSLYGQNLSELFQQGGYAVTSIDLATGARTFTPSNSIASWFDITYGENVLFGLFGGYQKNLGFNDNILSGTGTFLGRWQNIDHIYRISPSVKYTTGRLVLGAEVDCNVAAYGTVNYLNKGKVEDASEISGIRGLLLAMFLF